MDAKKTHHLIPLCHPLQTTQIPVGFRLSGNGSDFIGVEITAGAKGIAKTGFEMEALMAAAISALTIYDMCKAVVPGMTVGETRLVGERGGKSGVHLAGR